MRLFSLAAPFRAAAFCHGPVDRPFDPMGLISASAHDRWNERGEPTVYLAGDPGVALVELGRHLEVGPNADGEWPMLRTMWQVELLLERALDLREPDVRAAFGLLDGPTWLFDRRRCRELAATARSGPDVEGMIVPSAGMADDGNRWNAVVFAECLERPLESVVRDPRSVGSVCVERPDS